MSWKQILATEADRQHHHHVLLYRAVYGPYSPIGEALKSKCGAGDSEWVQDAILDQAKHGRPLEKMQVKFVKAIRAGLRGQPLDILDEIYDYVDTHQTEIQKVVDRQWWKVNRRGSGPSAGYKWD